MKFSEKTELGLIGLITLASAVFSQHLPHRVEIRFYLLAMALLFLCQSLLRDLWLIAKNRRHPPTQPPRVARCMCLESVVGITPIGAAALLFGVGFSGSISLPVEGWVLSVAAVMLTGFGLKDYVFEWNPWRIRRDPDHINIIFTLKKPKA